MQSTEFTGTPHILAVDDDRKIHPLMKRLFEREGIRVTTSAGAKGAVAALETHDDIALVLTDFMMPDVDGLELLTHVREQHPHISVIMMTGHSNVQHAVLTMREGAIDYIPKPFSTDELVARVKKGLKMHEEAVRNASRSSGEDGSDAARPSRENESPKTTFIGEHESIQQLKSMLPRVAASRAPVFVHGESGTGKEILSRSVHEMSDRTDGAYVTINCANLPSELVESHLFGHIKGAFTGAVENMTGAFERADGGTLLLDEVTEVTPAVQAKLLRVLQEQEFQKVGADEKQTVDVRVIATSNRNLDEAVSEGDFRADLYHRLAVFPLRVPPLRGRLSDIPLLAEHFVEKYASMYNLPVKTVAPDLLKRFQSHHWPGNVRELENLIHRGVVLAGEKEQIAEDDVINEFFSREAGGAHGGASSDLSGGDSAPKTISEMERQMILQTLADEDTNQKRAASKLGISARTIRNKLQKYREEGFAV